MAASESSNVSNNTSLDTSKDCLKIISKLGSVIRCTDKLGKVHEGEVLAYDIPSNVVILKIISSSRKTNLSNMVLVNLDHRDTIILIREPSRPPHDDSLPSLDHEKLNQRKDLSIKEKMRKVNLVRKDSSPVGQDLISTISKTIPEVRWNDVNIVVMNKVAIRPPYQVENCFEMESSDTLLGYVSKMVEKFHKERRMPNNKAA